MTTYTEWTDEEVSSHDAWLHERRRLFFSVMRRPEMRIVRAALKDLKWEHGINWEQITSLEVSEPFTIDGRSYGPWMLTTDTHLSICYDYADPTDFLVLPLNDPEPNCSCICCQEMREAQEVTA